MINSLICRVDRTYMIYNLEQKIKHISDHSEVVRKILQRYVAPDNPPGLRVLPRLLLKCCDLRLCSVVQREIERS